MSSHGYLSTRCFHIADMLEVSSKEGKIITEDDIQQLYYSCEAVLDSESGERFSKPMVWIGIYIAIASFLCILAMAADLLHGFRNKKFWFPSKYFSLNAASITVITITMKLPVDLSSGMQSYLDQSSKVGSLAFMCIMLANLMPSLASMDNKTLLANMIGLSILAITIIVNICIQIHTGVISDDRLDIEGFNFDAQFDFVMVAYIYMAMILLLLIMMISASLTIPASKEILESKYQAAYKISLADQHIRMSTVEKLRQHVKRYWVMAETGSPQFGMASNPLSTASGVVCVVVVFFNFCVVFKSVYGFYNMKKQLFRFMGASPYKWSTIAIFLTQSLGVMVGTIAPLSRCFSIFSFKLGTKWSPNSFMFFEVEKYWTQNLHDWKQRPVHFLSSCRRSRSLVYNSKNVIISLCIGFQKAIVILCKVIWLVVSVVPIFVVRWFTRPIPSSTVDMDEDLSKYAIQIDNETKLAERTLKSIANSLNSFILKAEKEQSNNLLKFLEKSKGFEGVEMFDTGHIKSLLPIELANSWSLPVVTLTSIAVALPDIHKDEVESLLRSVGEGLSFTNLVEESLDSASKYVNIRNTTMILWHEVENKCKWLDNPTVENVFKGKTTIEVVKWFSDKAKEIVTEFNKNINGDLIDNPPKTLIAANSMYRITQTLLLRFQSNIGEQIIEKQLFVYLNGMIADIFCACFTNIPRVIRMRCCESVIEKREASVKVAAKLLGKATKIIEILEKRVVPSMDDEKLASIDEWRLYLRQSFP